MRTILDMVDGREYGFSQYPLYGDRGEGGPSKHISFDITSNYANGFYNLIGYEEHTWSTLVSEHTKAFSV